MTTAVNFKFRRLWTLILLLILFSFAVPAYPDNLSKKQPAPDLMLKDIQGVSHRLSEWAGKVILLNFWATWCPPCRYEIPAFIEYQNQYADKGLQIIGVALDDKNKVENFVRTLGINYPVLLTDDNQLLNQWGNEDQLLPYTIIINQSGEIHTTHRGIFDDLAFEYQLRPLLSR